MPKTIFKKIEKLFEPEIILEHFSFLTEKSNEILNFETEDNVKLIENLGYFYDKNPNWELFFTRLAPFFEFGLFFKKNHLNTSFYLGVTHDCQDAKIHIQLPTSKIFSIYKTDAKSFLTKIKLQNLLSSEKLNCHLVRVTNEISFVLFSKKAEPWNKLLIESLQKSLINYSL